jgi:hypothetical protein
MAITPNTNGENMIMIPLPWLMGISAFIATINGLELIIAPADMLQLYGVELGPGGELMGRLSGAMLLGFALINWFARNSPPSVTLWAIVLGDCVTDGCSVVITLWVQLSGLVNALGWLSVIVYALFFISFGIHLFKLTTRQLPPIA